MPKGLPEQDIRCALTALAAADTWSIEGPLIRSRQCNIFKAQSPDYALDIAIKKYHGATPQAVNTQYQALEFYHSLFAKKTDVFAIPKPLGYLPQHGLVLMEWIAAPTLRRYLWGTLLRPSSRLALVRRAGAWLQCFHQLSEINNSEICAAYYRRKIEKKMAGDENAKKSLDQDILFSRALKLLHEQESLLMFKNFACVLLHGDFTPSNILMSPTGRVTGIDAWAHRQGPVMEDIARMIVYLSVTFPFPNSGGKEVQAFLSGYGESNAEANTPGFRYILLYQYLRRWIAIAQRARGLPLSMLDRWILARVKRCVSALCQAPAFQTPH